MSYIYYVYKIYNKNLDLSYIGSTSSNPEYRFKQHQSKNNKCRSRLLFGNPEHIVTMEILFQHITNDRLLIYQVERIFIERNTCVNYNIPTRTRAEYITYYGDEYKKRCKLYNKKYRLENKEKIKYQQKEYVNNNLNKIKAYQKIYQEKYRLKNKLKKKR